MELLNYFEALHAANGPSGFETAVTERAKALVLPLVEEVTTDAMGNLLAVRRCGKPDAKRLLLDAHLDEVGFIVTGIQEGFLKFAAIGGVDSRMLLGREVTVMSDPPLYGVIACLPPHVLTAAQRENAVETEDMYIDIGFSQAEAEQRVPLGTAGVYYGPICRLSGDTLCGRAMDDRLGAAILLKTLEALRHAELDVDLYLLLSTQEEVGLRGATTGAWLAEPDWCIAVDVTHAKTPDETGVHTFKAGRGCTVGVGPNANRNITQALRETAEKKQIPCQIEVLPANSGTDGWAIQLTRQGVATAILSVPLKYMHSPVETVRLSDAENAVRLLREFILGGVLK